MASYREISLVEILDILPGLNFHREVHIRCLATTDAQSSPSGCSNIISRANHEATMDLIRDGWDSFCNEGTVLDLLDMLTMLSPLFLCEHHQNQASHLASLWKNIFTQAYSSGALDTFAALAGAVTSVEGAIPVLPSVAPPAVAVPTSSSTTPAPRNSTGGLRVPVSEWPSKMVKPRPVEGECGICFLPFVGDEAKHARWNDKVSANGSSATGDPVDGHADTTDGVEDDDGHDEDDEGPEDEWDFEYDLFPLGDDYDVNLLVWCRGHCGTNFHRRCMERWIAMFKGDSDPTCPVCRRQWIEWIE